MVNPIKEKKLTNVRSSGKDDAIVLVPPIELTLEKAVEFIADDELVEITPQSIRLRKRFLKEHERPQARSARAEPAMQSAVMVVVARRNGRSCGAQRAFFMGTPRQT